MQLTSDLPLSLMFFKHWHTDGTEVGIVIAKALFKRHQDGKFRAVPQAPELVLEDTYEGDPANTALTEEQDIAPGKASTDIILNAIARAPDGEPAPDWPVSLTIPERVSYSFQIRGPSVWSHSIFGWKLGAPEPVSEVPITYALAYGGQAEGSDGIETFENNPAGLGFSTKHSRKSKQAFAAPQIGELAEFIAADLSDPMAVHGFGPIAKAWLPRRAEAGTFDEEWQRKRHPRMPDDYNLKFWNAAPTILQMDPPLVGNETLTLIGVSAAKEPVQVALPGIALVIRKTGAGDIQYSDMVLDTVKVDICDQALEEHTMLLTWRCIIPDPGAYEAAEVQFLYVEH